MHGSFLHCLIASQHNRQLQLHRRALLFNSLHEGAHILAHHLRIGRRCCDQSKIKFVLLDA